MKALNQVAGKDGRVMAMSKARQANAGNGAKADEGNGAESDAGNGAGQATSMAQSGYVNNKSQMARKLAPAAAREKKRKGLTEKQRLGNKKEMDSQG